MREKLLFPLSVKSAIGKFVVQTFLLSSSCVPHPLTWLSLVSKGRSGVLCSAGLVPRCPVAGGLQWFLPASGRLDHPGEHLSETSVSAQKGTLQAASSSG